ncbi:hypothetical protein AX17_000819 [Amanita inopinata Kibby_2008]|nr:hypothetical protein AX17_000819 [Amanita inopinata Kibby_2008]
MGSLCSKPGTHSETHAVLPSRPKQTSNALNSGSPSPPDFREAAAAAAEQRLKAVQAKGVHASNPKRGKLAAGLAGQKHLAPESRQEERLVYYAKPFNLIFDRLLSISFLSMETAENWQKVLWKRQPHPDDHIPQDFLSSLRKNPNFRPYTYWSLVSLSCAITQHLATICVFLSLFVQLKEQLLDPRTLIWLSVGCFVSGYMLWVFLDQAQVGIQERINSYLKTFKSSILIFLALMSLSPVLRTLTASTSSDSIWALSALLLTLNAILANYSVPNIKEQVTGRLTSVLSMNAAVSASVVLASRLTADIAVFGLMLFSIQAFALFPLLRHRFQASCTAIQILLTSGLVAGATWLTIPLSWRVACLYILLFFFVTFVAPGILMWAQKYKNELRGPWDVAVPRVN